MEIPVLHVHSHSDKSTIGFATFMWETMISLANHPEALKMTAHCLGPTAADRLSRLPNAQGFTVPNIEVAGAQGGSMAHGAMVEHALAMTDDGDIHLNVDSDTVVLAKGWDDYVRIQLLDKGIGIIGATFEDIGGFSSGNSNSQTFKKIPYTAWLAMSPKHEWRHMRVSPQKGVELPVNSPQLSVIYNLPVGYSVLRDVGWQIPGYLHDNGISYVGWKHLKGSKDATVLKGLSDYHEEFHVEDGVPFVVHHRGSLRHAYRGSDLSNKFYNSVDNYLAEEKKREPRWKWEPTEESAALRAQMQEMATSSKARIEEVIERAKRGTPPDPPPPTGPNQPAPRPQSQATIGGWLKATLDGNGVWNRYTQPVPQVIDVIFQPGLEGKHLRLEGTVSGVHITIPPAPQKPHWMTVRNLTAGPATVRTNEGRRTVEVPVNTCWQVLVDVDGVVRVE
jgi:hypothetical protein